MHTETYTSEQLSLTQLQKFRYSVAGSPCKFYYKLTFFSTSAFLPVSCFQGVAFNARLFLSPYFLSFSGQSYMQKFLEHLNIRGMSEGFGADLNLCGLQEAFHPQSRQPASPFKDYFFDQDENGGNSLLLLHFHTTSVPLVLETLVTKFRQHFLLSYIATKCPPSNLNPSTVTHDLSI